MSRTRCWFVLLALLGAASLVGCDEAEPTPTDSGSADGGASDAGPTPVECDVPAPLVAGTPETDAVADAPARCGQPAHTWLRSDQLGEVTETGEATRFTSRVLAGLAGGADILLPRPPERNVQLRTIRYVTQDRGELVESTALVAVPEGGPRGESMDVLLWNHGTTGFSQPCAPSIDTEGQLLVALFASFGYLVVAPDYLGLESGTESYDDLHPYLVGQPTAIAALDAVRAVSRLAPEARGEVCAAPRFVSFGASQGGHATLWVDRLAPYYARELTHLGAVATVPPADLTAQFERTMSMLVSGSGNAAAFYATAPFWYGLDDRLDEVFTSPLDTTLPPALETDCSPDDLDATSSLDEVFQTELIDAASAGTLADVDPWGCILAENSLPDTSIPRLDDEDVPGYGVMFLTGSEDGLVHTPLERAAYPGLCDAGMPGTYLECEGAEHGPATLYGLPEILRFIDARMADEPFTGSCDAPAAVRCEGTPAE